MNQALTKAQVSELSKLSDEKRASYFIEQTVKNNQIWILVDEHGCVMLNTEDEDCVPVWPDEELALLWANKEWQHCKAESISLNKWFSRWTLGLTDDEIAIVVFPSEAEQGMVYDPEDLEKTLKLAQKKSQSK